MSAPKLVVHVNQIENAEPVSREDVARAVQAVAEAEGVRAGEISVTFIEAPAIAALNETHLGQAAATDVIAFNLAEPRAPLGDVYVCPEIARASADELGIGLHEELLRLVIHGVLHLIGYEHPEGPERLESPMYARQESLLARLL